MKHTYHTPNLDIYCVDRRSGPQPGPSTITHSTPAGESHQRELLSLKHAAFKDTLRTTQRMVP